jgi:hypothetical protein
MAAQKEAEITLHKRERRKLALMLCEGALKGEYGTEAGWRLRVQSVWLRKQLGEDMDAPVTERDLNGEDAAEYGLEDADL